VIVTLGSERICASSMISRRFIVGPPRNGERENNSRGSGQYYGEAEG